MSYRDPMARIRDKDACPGSLQVHQAADGALARVRLPGGMIGPHQLEALAHAANDLGSPAMELTSRGNIQIRALTDAAKMAEIVAGVGLLPSETHERARNIVASPLSGRAGGSADIRDVVTELDGAIQAEPELAGLPGRFLFGVDDGRADISGLGADVGVHVVDESTALLLAGRDTGVRVPMSDAAAALVQIAVRFAVSRGKCLAGDGTRRSRGSCWMAFAPAQSPGRRGRPSPGRQSAGSSRTTAGWRWALPFRWGCCRRVSRSILAAINAPMVDHAVALRARLRSRRQTSPTPLCGYWRRWGLVFDEHSAVAFGQRVHGPPRLRAFRRPTSAPTPRRAIDEPATGASPALRRVRTRLRQSRRVRSWWRPETDTGRAAPTRRVSGCSTTSATPPRSTGSRSPRSAPRPTCRDFPTTSHAWWCG